LLKDLANADEPISTRAAIHQFIFTLGSEFETIQNNFRINNLPDEWKTLDWPTLLTLCRDYYNSIKPLGVSKKSPANLKDQAFDREVHQKKVREWFMSPQKFGKELEAMQKKLPGQCIFHLLCTHATPACFIKKECDKLLAEKKSGHVSPSGSETTGTLHHLTEEIVDDVLPEEEYVDSLECDSNDTNDDVLAYFTRMTKHYLRLANSAACSTRHPMKYPIIADSGANYHMFKEQEFFVTLRPMHGTVLLGDGITSIDIKGVGTVQCLIDGHLTTLHNVRYIPSLGESISSLFLHIKTPQHGLDTTSDQGLFIKFPDFQTKAIIGLSDIYLNAHPIAPSIDNATILGHETSVQDNCHQDSFGALTTKITQETTKLDNILCHLRKYYASVTTKRQLGYDVPAGFHRASSQQQLLAQMLPSPSSVADPLQNAPDSILHTFSESSVTSSVSPENSSSEQPTPSHNLPSDSSYVPIVRSVDKASSSLPSTITMTEDFIRASVGFRAIDTMIKQFYKLYQPTTQLDNTPADAILDDGYFANMRKRPRNTNPVSRPSHFGKSNTYGCCVWP
jgi:hypothetical protein